MNSAPLQHREAHNHGSGKRKLVAGEHWKKCPAIFPNHNRHGRSSPARGEPIAPANNKSGVFADGAPRKIILAAAPRNRRAKFSNGWSAEKGVKSADDPNGKKKSCLGKAFRDVAWRANDTGGNRIADRRGNSKPHAEDLQQFAAADKAA